ncbi:hypothetical protein A3F34_01580 [Candidatus Roizmanbacteria bacterium RIFCSPHIGHO2_12_FULL_44_10]|uniref:Uncharacterized protein n=1 Tax=Candidatus Roizmanbacteria bacterium RIFCSPHIGHO2_12_FULL_44_10 TaxID=1802054 RepID=A0A1F7I5H4_9BACT|nr:MAG: hypothetical protein A3F34_01580 [Candidatus Roizmanbacteria bacterium RIFCSPHIGHO2_12_FULL_44_10]
MENAPSILFYATINFADGTVETPHFFVFEKLLEGIQMIKDHYRRETRDIESIEIKTVNFIEERALPEETHILLPSNDHGLSEDPRDPEAQQEMVMEAEQGDRKQSIMGVFPIEQEGEKLLCLAFFMGPFMEARSIDDFIKQLKEDPFEVSLPIDDFWFYRPTGEKKVISLRN